MNKKDIIDLFLKNGVMLAPDELENINEQNYMQVLEKKLGETNDEILIAKQSSGKISCGDFIKLSNRKFEFLREILLKKTDAVSINKGRKVFAEATIIGRVKERNANGFVLEDVTGETEVMNENNDVKTGDIVGLRGFFKENRFFPNQIIWPDIPLENNPRPPGAKITLTARIKETMAGLIICPSGGKAGNIISGFGRLGSIKIKKHGGEIHLLAFSPEREMNDGDAVKTLKKRQISDDGIADNLIADIPGIFWLFNNGKNWTKNYRGVVIISSDSGSFAEYDNGEVHFGGL